MLWKTDEMTLPKEYDSNFYSRFYTYIHIQALIRVMSETEFHCSSHRAVRDFEDHEIITVFDPNDFFFSQRLLWSINILSSTGSQFMEIIYAMY